MYCTVCVCLYSHAKYNTKYIITFGRINGDKWTHSMLCSVSAQNVGIR